MTDMKQYLMWWLLIKHLRDFSQLQPELNGVDVRAGAKKPKDPYPCMEIIWDSEDGFSLYKTEKGELNLWIDLWIRNDNKDPSAAYEVMADLMERVCTVLVRWSDALLKERKISTNIDVKDAISDAETNRPLIGTRMVIKIDWRRSRYERIQT
ncbi:hypothetical protein [Sporomusa sphaeroides]|uniref:hypothetical protein n=1 Tax=Sporomusa sphaeroides TaxID=47679 RepID=UPI002C007889|nr:hypothetical protein [Sporomusa sphaeroides]HML33853.1 hypothetical protein [Sporomusa sphaeroides]